MQSFPQGRHSLTVSPSPARSFLTKVALAMLDSLGGAEYSSLHRKVRHSSNAARMRSLSFPLATRCRRFAAILDNPLQFGLADHRATADFGSLQPSL